MGKKMMVQVQMVTHGLPLSPEVERNTIRTTKGTAMILPPPAGKCQECAVDHKPEEPHNRDSLYYQMAFRQKHGRWPTWADAIAHCPEEARKAIREMLEKDGVWSEPEEGLSEEEKTARTIGGMPTHSMKPDGGAVFGDMVEVEMDDGRKKRSNHEPRPKARGGKPRQARGRGRHSP